jgi:hypothetical protein
MSEDLNLDHVIIGEYGIGTFTDSPKKGTVYFIDVDTKEITKEEALVSYCDNYIYEKEDIGEVDMVIAEDHAYLLDRLLNEEGYTLEDMIGKTNA